MKKPYIITQKKNFGGYYCYACDLCTDENNGGGCGMKCPHIIFCPTAYISYSHTQLKERHSLESLRGLDENGSILPQMNFVTHAHDTYWRYIFREGQLNDPSRDKVLMRIFGKNYPKRANEIRDAELRIQEGSFVLPDQCGTRLHFRIFQPLVEETYWGSDEFIGHPLAVSIQKGISSKIIDLIFPIQMQG